MIEFLQDLFGYCDGEIEIRTLPDRSQRYFNIDDIAEIEKYANAKTEKKQNVFFGVSTRDGQGGGKENIVNIPAVWVDIDFKETPENEAVSLIKNGPIMPTYIVRSGGGFHCYWKLSEPCEDIAEVESVMLKLIPYYKADRSAFDASRILRLPGTKNYKYDIPAVVTVKKTGKEVDISSFEIYPEPEIEYREIKAIDPTEELNAIMSCEFMKHCQNNARFLSEPEWFAMVSQLAGKKGGPSLIHHLSRPYPGYSIAETDRKILSSINDGGPMTCGKIKQLFDCKKDCGVKTPASLLYHIRSLGYHNDAHDADDALGCGMMRNDAVHHVDNYDYEEPVRHTNLTEAIREYVEESTGYFTGLDVDRELGIPQSRAHYRRTVLSRLCKEKVIKKDRNNKYIKNIINIEFIDTSKTNDEAFPLTLPLGLSSLVTLPPKSIMVVAGSSNAGKTAFLLNLLKANLTSSKDIVYLMSEMGPQEYISRAKGVCGDEHTWKSWQRKIKAADISTDFAAAIQTYAANGISVVDFLEEVDGEYFKIASAIRNIYDGLEDGVSVVALQKHTESEYGRGGQATSEKARLYLSIDKVAEDDTSTMVALKIIKAKTYLNRNPNGKEIHLRVVKGSHIEPLSDWLRTDRAGREAMFEKYKTESELDRRVRLEVVSY